MSTLGSIPVLNQFIVFSRLGEFALKINFQKFENEKTNTTVC